MPESPKDSSTATPAVNPSANDIRLIEQLIEKRILESEARRKRQIARSTAVVSLVIGVIASIFGWTVASILASEDKARSADYTKQLAEMREIVSESVSASQNEARVAALQAIDRRDLNEKELTTAWAMAQQKITTDIVSAQGKEESVSSKIDEAERDEDTLRKRIETLKQKTQSAQVDSELLDRLTGDVNGIATRVVELATREPNFQKAFLTDLLRIQKQENSSLADRIGGALSALEGLKVKLSGSGPHDSSTISTSGADLRPASCPPGLFVNGLQASVASGGRFAGQSIVVLNATCERLF